MFHINGVEDIEVTSEDVARIENTWERTDLERPHGLEDVLNYIWTWPSACVEGRMAAMVSVRNSTVAGPIWAVYLAYVEETSPHALVRAAGLVGATMRRTCDWSVGSWVKLTSTDVQPELVTEPFLARLGDQGLGPNQRVTAYRSGGHLTIAVRNTDAYPEATNCEPPAWFGEED